MERAREILSRLEYGENIPDPELDQLFPKPFRAASENHWTSVQAAKRAVELLVDRPRMRILDVGSGVGKFCLVGALTSTAYFTGVEQRASLVRVAQRMVDRFSIPRIEFWNARIQDIDWRPFHGFYFFNPFVENFYRPSERIDATVELSPLRYRKDLRFVQHQLGLARGGTRVVTYHGLGGAFPPEYRLVTQEPMGEDFLQLWVKDG